MTDDVYFGELPGTLVQPENNLSLSEDSFSLGQDRLSLSQDHNVPVRSPHHGQKQVTEMVISPWYLDEFGNPTREIRARD